MSELLITKLSDVRSKHITVLIFTGIAIAVAFVIGWTAVSMFIDWHVANGLPRWGRAVLLALEIAGLGAIVFARIIRPFTLAPDDEEVALMIERHWPDFKTRLIASIQLTQPEAAEAHRGSKALVKAMVHQTETLADETQVTDVVATRALNRSLITAAVFCCLGLFLFLWAQPTSWDLLARAFLSDVRLPTKTHIKTVTGDLNVALGDSLKIVVTVEGYQPASGTIEINYASGRYQELPLDRDAGVPGGYSVMLDAVQESFTYAVTVYDGHSETSYSVRALERPAIADVEFLQVYPAYTGMGTVARQAGDLTLLAGSRLKLKVTSTKPLRASPLGPGQSNYVQRFIDEKVGHSDTVPLLRYKDQPTMATVNASGMDLPAGLDHLAIHLIDTDDLESKDTAVYPVEVVPDRTPTIRISLPERKEELVTAQATLEIGYLAEDDYLLGKLTLFYKIDDGTVLSAPIPLPAKSKSYKASYLWDISKLPVPSGKPTLEGSVVEYWLEVEDTNNLSGPGKTDSEHYAARVVTRAEKQAEMMARSGETIGGIRSASDNQDSLADKIGRSVNQQPGTRPAPPKP